MVSSTETGSLRAATFFALVVMAGSGTTLAGDPTSDPAAKAKPTHAVARDIPAKDHVRHLPFENAANFRDLGGYTTAEGKRVRWGLLYRSDALDSLTAADMKLLTRLNLANVTDFRSRGEIAKRPDRLPAELEARHVHLPMDDTPARAHPQTAKEIDAANTAFMEALESANETAKLGVIDRLVVDHYYPRLARDGKTAYTRWLHGLLDGPDDSARLFHCTGGADRTGLAAALLLLVLGVPKEQILEDYLLTNRYLFSPHGRALLERKGVTAMPPGYRLQARYLEASFAAMENDHGSVDNYLREGLGISDEVKRKLRARYLESEASDLVEASRVAVTSRTSQSLPALHRFKDPRPIVIAHRGCWQRSAENSLASLEACIRQGIDAAEIDVQVTKDGALMLLHDDDLARTTSFTGALSDFTLAQLAHARLREGEGGPNARLTNESIPTFSDVLRLAKGRLVLYLDIKCRACEEAIVEQVETDGAQDWVIFGGRMDNQRSPLPTWARRQTVIWINDCKWAHRFTSLRNCFDSFADGVKSFGVEQANLFLSMSLETSFYTVDADDQQLRTIKPIVGAYIADRVQLSDEEALAESKRQWTLFLNAGSPAIIGDFPEEMLELMRTLGKR